MAGTPPLFPVPPGGQGPVYMPGFIPSYPGPPGIHLDPAFQYGPRFNGRYAAGSTTNPYLNSLFTQNNFLQDSLSFTSGTGYPPFGLPVPPGVGVPAAGQQPGTPITVPPQI